MNLTADQLMKIAGIASTDTLRARLNEFVDDREGERKKKFEVIEVSQDGTFDVEVVEATGPAGAVIEYFGDADDLNLLAALEKDIQKNRSGGWYMRNDGDRYIIREM